MVHVESIVNVRPTLSALAALRHHHVADRFRRHSVVPRSARAIAHLFGQPPIRVALPSFARSFRGTGFRFRLLFVFLVKSLHSVRMTGPVLALAFSRVSTKGNRVFFESLALVLAVFGFALIGAANSLHMLADLWSRAALFLDFPSMGLDFGAAPVFCVAAVVCYSSCRDAAWVTSFTIGMKVLQGRPAIEA